MKLKNINNNLRYLLKYLIIFQLIKTDLGENCNIVKSHVWVTAGITQLSVPRSKKY